MLKNCKKSYMFMLTVIGILGSFFFVILGYWIAAAMGIMNTESESFIQAINIVLDNPFAKYFNNYTPIVMILGFILFEFFFFVYLLKNRKNVRREDSDAEDESMYTVSLNTFHNEMPEGISSDQNVSSDINSSSGNDIPDDIEVKSIDKTNDENLEEEVSFSEDLAMELLETYDMEQITAMLSLSKYMNKIDAVLLKKMFNPEMSAEEITEYINIFYD